MKVTRNDIGKAVMVRYDDVGRVEGVLIDLDTYDAPNRRNIKRAKVFFLSTEESIDTVELEQIVEVGKRITIPQ